MQLDPPSQLTLFDGVPADELRGLFGRLEHRRLRHGAVLLTEGQHTREIYVIDAGTADVFVAGPDGEQHHVNRLGPGGLLGEMSLLMGQPASATVKAVGQLDVLVIDESEFESIAATYPRIYHNVGAIVSRKVYDADRRSLQGGPRMHATLLDRGAPPQLARALVCSVAWHGQRPTLLLDLAHAGQTPEWQTPAIDDQHHVQVRSARLEESFALDQLPRTIHELGRTFDHILVLLPGSAPSLPGGATLRLSSATGAEGGPGYELRAWSPEERFVPPSDGAGVIDIPPLASIDERAMQQGVLPPHSPTGRRLAWIARDLLGQKVGLALGGGGAKGYAHIGVLSALERLGVPVDFLAGTSIGAAVGALYALGHRSDGLAGILDQVGTVLVRPALPTRGLLSDAALRDKLREIGGQRLIEELYPPLAIVAADIATGSEVIFRKGLVWSAVLASIAIPGVYPAQRMGGRILVDGGVVNPIPRGTVAAMGADVVLAVNLRTRRAEVPVSQTAVVPSGRPPAIFEVLASAVEMLQSRVAAPPLRQPTVEITPSIPDVPGWGLRHFEAGRAYIDPGEDAVRQAVPRLEAVLPWLAATPT